MNRRTYIKKRLVTAILVPAILASSGSGLFATAPADTSPPQPSHPVIDTFTGGSVVLHIQFDEQLDPGSVQSDGAFTIQEEITPDSGSPVFRTVQHERPVFLTRNDTLVELRFRHLNPGLHRITFKGVKDLAGNAIPGGKDSANPGKSESATVRTFMVPSGPIKGEQIEYPRFLPNRETPEDIINPGDRVDTKVLQLYYLRDARVVAEYINRNIQDLNQTAFDEAQQFAREARTSAEQSIDSRRFKESVAVQSAERSREVERKLAQTQGELQKQTSIKDDLDVQEKQLHATAIQLSGDDATKLPNAISAAKTSQLSKESELSKAKTLVQKIPALEGELAKAQNEEAQAAGTAIAAAKDKRLNVEQQLRDARAAKDAIGDLNAEITELKNKRASLETLLTVYTKNQNDKQRNDAEIKRLDTSLGSGDTSLQSQLVKLQENEITSRNDVLKAEAQELRAAQEQFRRELAAGLADRNSYVKGKKESEDPVAQVTISVVGTSRLQLRGPIKGINKIARMVHQLDSPVGQVKIGIHTIQVNGEHGDRMDFVYERINQEVAHSRFLVNTSGQLLRRAVQEVASEVALAADQGYLPEDCPPDLMIGRARLDGQVQTTQEMRNRRYLYAFFGSDFIGELEEMDSEFLNSENKLLSLHSMDTISLPGALFVMAHADHPVRQRIVQRFQELIAGELPQRETEYVQSLTHVTPHGKPLRNRYWRAIQIDNDNAEQIYFNASRTYHFPNTVSFFNTNEAGAGTLNPVQYSTVKLAQALKAQLLAEIELKNLVLQRSVVNQDAARGAQEAQQLLEKRKGQLDAAIDEIESIVATALSSPDVLCKLKPDSALRCKLSRIENLRLPPDTRNTIVENIRSSANNRDEVFKAILVGFGVTEELLAEAITKPSELEPFFESARKMASSRAFGNLQQLYDACSLAQSQVREASVSAASAEQRATNVKKTQRILEQFIDEQEEKSVDLMEAMRSHSSNVDNYLKRLAIAIEDDVAAQFYEPAFQRIRRVSRTWDVTLGQIETTTVLTNNRTLAKVSPAASFEFDLPKRDILIKEALDGAKALAIENGNLLKDPTFIGGAQLLSPSPATGIVGTNATIQGIPGLQQSTEFGSELEKLIPPPSVFKIETGTGFEIQPVIQPDGHSIVYTFDYEYSTNVREPVRADEKHLGRIKRHFVHTDVQTSSYELREISRYTVALKVSRTDRGVPLFEDIPVVGAAFRPLPSDESSLQTNIILGSSTIYPTVFDLMGLRWSNHVDELGTSRLAEQKRQQSGRREEIRNQLINTTTEDVNELLGLPHRAQSPQLSLP